MRTTPPRLWLMMLCLVSLATALHAREGDLSQPINVSADRSEYDERAGTQTLRGNVEIRQGTMRIRADEIVVRLVDGRLGSVEGNGSPVEFEQQNDAGDLMQGSAERILYDAIAGTLTLDGGAKLTQPRQSLESRTITFNARTQRVSAEGNGDGGRVNLQIRPPDGNSD